VHDLSSIYARFVNHLSQYVVLRDRATDRQLPSETATSRFARRKLLCLPPPLLIGAIQQFATRRAGQSWSPPRSPPRACLLSVLLSFISRSEKPRPCFAESLRGERGERGNTEGKGRRETIRITVLCIIDTENVPR